MDMNWEHGVWSQFVICEVPLTVNCFEPAPVCKVVQVHKVCDAAWLQSHLKETRSARHLVDIVLMI